MAQQRGNERLRRALHAARLRESQVAQRVGVDPKTVQRWLAGRLPHPRHRWAVAELLDCPEHELWPQLADSASDGFAHEIVASYPQRGSVPQEVWRSFFAGARREIGILVHDGLFLAEDLTLLSTLVHRAEDGVRVRFLLADPEGPQPRAVEAGEERGPSPADRVRAGIRLYRPLTRCPGAEVRLYRAEVYHSLFRADRDLLVNHKVFGATGPHTPVLHLRRHRVDVPRGAVDLVRVYLDSFEAVWAAARPLADSSMAAPYQRRTSR